jgi:Lipoprotein LpqB beta-propeller domain/Sporulation and spore germination
VRGRAWLVAPGAIAVAVAACANLPTSGTIQVSTLHGSGVAGQGGVQMVPRAPVKGWLPVDIVTGFMQASGSYDPHHRVAREYLTSGKHGFGRRWRPGWAATIIDSPKVSQGRPVRNIKPQPPGTYVSVKGRHLAKLQTAGSYQAGNIVVAPSSTKFDFWLTQVSGQWRISGISVDGKQAPRTLLLLTESDFERDYQPRNLYFYAPGEDSTTLVPDPVYIPQQAGNQGIAGLVGALLHRPPGPPAVSWLYDAATTSFPRGTKLLGVPQVIGGVTAIVNLGGAAVKASPEQLRRMQAQLQLTLAHSPYSAQTPNPIQSVELELNGHAVPPLPTGAYEQYLPGDRQAPLYYQVAGSGTNPPQVVMWASAKHHVSISLPKPLGAQQFSAMAVSMAPTGSAVLAGCVGRVVYLMPQASPGTVVTKQMPTKCASLSWDVHGNLWIGTRTEIWEIPAAGQVVPPARPALVLVIIPLFTHVEFRYLQVAPDGVRAALIVHTGSTTEIEIAAISEHGGITYLAQSDRTLRVGSDVSQPVALTWLDPDHLLVLDQTSQGIKLFDVPLNGGQSIPVAIPPGVTSVAANSPKAQAVPRIVVAIATGTIEVSAAEPPNTDWKPLVTGTTPVFPG